MDRFTREQQREGGHAEPESQLQENADEQRGDLITFSASLLLIGFVLGVNAHRAWNWWWAAPLAVTSIAPINQQEESEEDEN